MAANLIVLDEFGYEPLDRESANLLFRVINYRYGKGDAIAITTNKGIAGWPSILADDEVLAGAILDRLLHNATVLNIQGRSDRLKELDAQLQQQSVTRSGASPEVSGRDVEVEGGGKSNAAGPSIDAHPPEEEATTI